jgi:alpha-L-fucosidase
MPVFEATLESLRTHQVPDWYEDAKLGIFIHWGLASVPGWAPLSGSIHDIMTQHRSDPLQFSPYTEWYLNSMKFPDSPTARHHAETYGADTPYDAFREPFETMLVERWTPEPWTDLFAAAGARYVVQVTKHHDGYTLWPSDVTNPHKPDWNAPRDAVAELATSVRARGMRFGVYYSAGLDWTFKPEPFGTVAGMMASVPTSAEYCRYVDGHLRELIERIRPDVLWNDIGYPPGDEIWRLLADYYNTVQAGVVNDRWIQPGPFQEALKDPAVRARIDEAIRQQNASGETFVPPEPPHYDYQTPEYATFHEVRERKWECVRGMGNSFGYNRQETEKETITGEELIHLFVDIVSKNGNLLINVGPTGEEGTIPEIQARPLRELGAWLERNGEAIYATRPWTRPEGRTDDGTEVRFTRKGSTLFAILLATPRPRRVTLPDVRPRGDVRLLGHGPVEVQTRGESVEITLPELPPGAAHALAFHEAA